jgi:hypothetical protein
MKILLGDFNAKVDREDIFKPTTRNKSLHEITSDNAVTAVNFAISKSLSRVLCSHLTTFINSLDASWRKHAQSDW